MILIRGGSLRVESLNVIFIPIEWVLFQIILMPKTSGSQNAILSKFLPDYSKLILQLAPEMNNVGEGTFFITSLNLESKLEKYFEKLF